MKYRVGIVGFGVIGSRRAAVVDEDAHSQIMVVADNDPARAQRASERYRCQATTDWHELVDRPDVDIVIVSVINKYAPAIAVAAASRGKHILFEKPLGRSAAEARQVVDAVEHAGVFLKVGCNLRFHPAIAEAHRVVASGEVGKPIVIRAVYGHGGRLGYEKEWRTDRDLAGGGELLDQGVHLVDLSRWFLGEARYATAVTRQSFWNIGGLEDNAFALIETTSGAVAMLHASWTEWRNTFRLDVMCNGGYVKVDGLGGSYGDERLLVGRRQALGATPEESLRSYPAGDVSWHAEWASFITAIRTGVQPMSHARDALKTMELVDAIYQSASDSSRVSLEDA